MKVKKLASLIVLLFANLLLLAHGVMPHYHHDGIICIVRNEVCHTVHDSQKHSDNSECEYCVNHHTQHQQHAHDNSEDCDLKNVVLRHGNSYENDTIQPISISNLYFIAYTLNIFYLDTPAFGLRVDEKPYLENYTPPFVGSISSLRAPPFISALS